MGADTPPTTLTEGHALLAGRYRYEGELGQGSSGRVIALVEVGSEERLVAKTVAPADALRLAAEFDALRGIRHPHVVRARELLRVTEGLPAPFSLRAGAAVLIEAHLDGDALVDGPATASWKQLCALGATLAAALTELHHQNLVHGDVSPNNVLMTERGPVLVDLGHAGGPVQSGPFASGTLGYMAPEAFFGARTPAGDLFSLAATLLSVAPGAPRGLRSPSLHQAHEQALRWSAALGVRLQDAPEGLAALFASMLATSPSERLDDAQEVAQRLLALSDGSAGGLPHPAPGRLSGPRLAGRLRHARHVGHGRELRDTLKALVQSAPSNHGGAHSGPHGLKGLSPAVVYVEGPPGSGRDRFALELAQGLQRAAFDAGWDVPTLLESELLPKAPKHPTLLLLRAPITRTESDMSRLSRWLDAAEVDGAPSVILCAQTSDAAQPSVAPSERAADTAAARAAAPTSFCVRLGPVSRDAVEELLTRSFGERPSAEALESALQLSGGLVGLLCEVLATAALEGTLGRLRDLGKLARSPRRRASEAAAPLRLPEATRELLERACVCRDGLPLPVDVVPGLSEALTLGLLSVTASGLLVPRPDVCDATLESMTERRIANVAGALLAVAQDPLVRAHLHLQCVREPAAPPRQEDTRDVGHHATSAERELQHALRECRRGERDAWSPRRLVDLLRRLPRASDKTRSQVAEVLRRGAEYALALEVLEPSTEVTCVLEAAEIARQSGDLQAARRILGERLPRDAEAGLSGDDLYIRVAGRMALDLALRADAPAASGTGPSGAALWRETPETLLARFEAARADTWHESPAFLEVRALHAWFQGDLDRADADAELASAMWARRGFPGHAARSESLRATVAQRQAGQDAQYQHGRRAVEFAHEGQERLAGAIYSLNLGLACFDLGRLGPALERVRSASETIAEIGRDSVLALAVLNLALLYMASGDDVSALPLLSLAERAAQRCESAHVRSHIALARSRIASRRGHRAEAAAYARDALELAAAGPPGSQALLRARAASAYVECHEHARAAELLNQLESEAQLDTHTSSEVLWAQGMLALHGGPAPGASASEIARSVHSLAERAQSWQSGLRAWLLLSELRQRAGESAGALSALRRARALLDAALDSLPNALRHHMLRAARYQSALSVMPTDSPTTAHALHPAWRELPTWMQRFIQSTEAQRMHERIADAALSLTRAERGFLVEREGPGLWKTLASTDPVAADVSQNAAYSRSLAARALETGRPVSALDALRDDALRASGSVLGIGTRSVLAAPLHVQGRDLVLYVDDRLRPAVFDTETEELLGACAHLAGLALGAAHDASALRGQQAQLRRAEAALREHVATQREEITSLRRAIHTADYGGIIAGAGPMRRTLELAERAAASSVPISLLGESGTGKELVARFLHERSERSGARFISENCSAIPDALLESTLFGHERGAFTGADKSRRGLFHAADGGTLFLDEIGEMSAAMQAKLLRVLQNGEVRPVGGNRVSRVDVRLITATHRDLVGMVAAGTFREDLYYRIAVVTLELPPLRARRDDIPLLVRHFLRKHGGERAPTLSPAAMQLLAQGEWPGNVRQLENEILRLLVMAGPQIDARDIHSFSHGSTGVGQAPAITQSLEHDPSRSLREHVDDLERELIAQALERTGHNQTRAAQELGLSRYGLQKMMKRLGLR